MANFLLHTDQLSERGTETSLYFLGKELQRNGHRVSICYGKESPSNNQKVIAHFSDNFELIAYRGFSNMARSLSRDFDFAYHIKVDGRDGNLVPNIHNAIHVVFGEYRPHGDSYVFISEWVASYARKIAFNHGRIIRRGPLARIKGCKNAFKFESVPHMVDMPPVSKYSRSEFGIPEDSFVIIRIGGMPTFDLLWARKALLEFLLKNKDAYFIAVNTPKFTDLKRVIHIDTVTSNIRKSELLSMSDLFLHARSGGESFGMAIVESMQIGTPVIAWRGGRDLNHHNHLGNFNLLYEDARHLSFLLESFKSKKNEDNGRLSHEIMTYADQFRPDRLISSYMSKMFRYDS